MSELLPNEIAPFLPAPRPSVASRLYCRVHIGLRRHLPSVSTIPLQAHCHIVYANAAMTSLIGDIDSDVSRALSRRIVMDKRTSLDDTFAYRIVVVITVFAVGSALIDDCADAAETAIRRCKLTTKRVAD